MTNRSSGDLDQEPGRIGSGKSRSDAGKNIPGSDARSSIRGSEARCARK